MTGYVKAQRGRFDHPLFRREKFCRGYAWDWLVAHAAYRDHDVEIKGRMVTLRRGQLSYSIRYLANAWNWDKAAVSRFLARLQTETMIETSAETGQVIITVCNYDRYQGGDDSTETEFDTAGETAARQQRDSSETNKKKEKKEEGYSFPLPVNDASEAVRIYLDTAERCGWSGIKKMTPARNSQLKQRLKDCGGLDGWREAMARAEASDFICGKVPGRDGPFKATFDFFMQQSSFVKLMEGKYDNRQHRGNTQSGGWRGDAQAEADIFAAAVRNRRPTRANRF